MCRLQAQKTQAPATKTDRLKRARQAQDLKKKASSWQAQGRCLRKDQG
jgi:hypothetical protein